MGVLEDQVSPQTIFDLLQRSYGAVAKSQVLLATGRKPASYDHLLSQVRKTAGTLSQFGVVPAGRVATVLPNGPEMVSLFLAITAVAACAPLNPGYRAEDFEFYLGDLRPKLLIVDSSLDSPVREVARKLGIETVELKTCPTCEAGVFRLDEDESATDFEPASGDDVALLLHTSGTTSRPKLVPLTHNRICASARNIAASLALTPEDRCLNVMPLFHIHGLVGAVLSSLSVGAGVVCTPGFNATQFFDWLQEFQPTWYSAVPTMHQAILARATETDGRKGSGRLRFIRSCSAPLPPAVLAALEKKFGVPVVEAYGMTEASHQMASNPLPPRARKPGSVGVPTGAEVAIMDNRGNMLPATNTGEVVVRGPSITTGYESNPEANAKSFTNGWFRTGDEGYIDSDGYIFLTGRIKELINRGGEKISPREIDDLLLSHPAVAQALAFAIPDAKLGEEVGAAVVLKSGQKATELEVQEHVARRTADFKVPRRVVFLEKLPTGPTGKPQRIGLAKVLGWTEPTVESGSGNFVAPRNDTEAALAELWCDVLGTGQASVHDDFFAVGGDSLLAAQLIGRVRKRLRIELSMPRLFSMPTIGQLAEWISQQHSDSRSNELTIARVERSGEIPLSFPQRRMWFASQLAGDSPVYNRAFAIRLRGPLDIFRLQQSLTAVVDRHEILRTTYRMRDGVPMQRVGTSRPVPIALVDLTRQAEDRRVEMAANWAREEMRKPFNLASDQMLRVGLARLGADDHILLFVTHHIAFDATSQAPFLRDLAEAYQGVSKAMTEIDYADFASWQLTRGSENSRELSEWWKNELRDLPWGHGLPMDFSRPARQSYRGGTVSVTLGSEESAKVVAVARDTGATPFMLLLAAYSALASRYSGSAETVVGTPTSGRMPAETEEIVGLFVNLLVLRTKVKTDGTFRDLVNEVRATTVRALEHQDFPFEKLVEALAPERSLSQSPLFQVMFEYRNHPSAELKIEGITAEAFEFETGNSQYDLHFDIRPDKSGMKVSLHYNGDLFRRESAERILGDFQAIIGSAVANPSARISELECPGAVAKKAVAAAVPQVADEQQHQSSIPQQKRLPGDTYPLSFAQERLWFLHQLEPESAAYTDPILLQMLGPLNLECLRRAIEMVITRHEPLRTTFRAKDGITEQVVHPPTRFHLPVFDLASQSDGEQEAERIQQAEFRRPFNLETDLMLRAIVIRLSPEHHQLLFIINHIATDGWSNGLLLKELGYCYSALIEGGNPELPALPLQYRDFALWQRQALTDEALQEHLDYWKTELADIPSGPQLLTDYPRPAKQTYSGGYLSFPLSDDLSAALNDFGRKERVTLFMTILAAFSALLHRYTNQETIVVGTPVANRDRVELEPVVGFFVNTLPLRCDLSGNPTFRELLSRIREGTLNAFEHQELPFEKLVQALRPERSLSHSPVFQTLLAVQNTPTEPPRFSGLSVARKIFERENAQFDLSTFVEFFPNLRIAYSYNSDLFAKDTIARMAGHFENILRAGIANPGERISRLCILSDAEVRQLGILAHNKRPYPNRCIHELFEEIASKNPEKVALVQGTQSITFRQLNQRANRLAHDFVSAGVHPGDRVGLLFQRSIDVIVGMLATLKAGAAFVPIDPAYPKARVNFIADDCGIKVFFTDTQFAESLPDGSRIVFKADNYREDGQATANLGLQLSQENAAYVIFTSGSTGTPKGVEVPHCGIVRLVFAQDYASFGPEQTTLQLCSLSFDVSQFEIWASLLHGATCVIFSGQQIDAENIGKDISEHGVVSMWLTTSLFNAVMDESPAVLAPVRQLLIGGEALSVPHIFKALEKLPDTRLINGYGPTENSVFSNCYPIPREISRNIRSIPIGAPIANTSAFIFDQSLQLVPIGVPGELCVGGDGVAIGYVNRPELNAASFIPNPISGATDKRVYKTGDLCRWLPDGTIEYLGRGDGQVKVRGFRVELGEVEAAVKQHPSVKSALAIVWGQGSDRRLVAYVVPSNGGSVRAADLKEYLRKTLPEYMVPSQFVLIPRLPLLDSGKVDKKALPAPIFSSAEVVEPADELELKLKEIWEETLGVPSIGVNQDFFDLGGHSLLAIKLLARVQRNLSVKLPIASLFQAPTIIEFAKLVRWKSQVAAPVTQKRSLRPLFWVGGGVFLRVVSSSLQPEREVIPIGLDMDEWLSLEKPFKVEEIARILVRHITSQHPEGPYYIGGWCYEGVLAYETALQLQRENRDVDLLILVDAVTPQSRISMSRFDRIAARFHREVFHLRNLVRLSPAEWFKYLRDRYTEFIEYRKRTHWQKNSGHDLNALTFEDERNRIIHLAMLNYFASPYCGNLLFCQAGNRPAGAYWDLASEWRSLATGNAEFFEIAGSHVSMLEPPNVDLFATKVKVALDAASKKHRRSPETAGSCV